MKTLALLLLSAVLAQAATDVQSLAGKWRFAIDRGDFGIADRWFERELPDNIKLPGSLPEQGIGDKPSLDTKWTGGIQDRRWWENPIYAPYAKSNDFRFPFWLQPETYYVGAAWYQRDFTVPKDWAGKRVALSLERPHWETRVWIDGKLIGTNNALGTPHEYDLGELAPGKHSLTIRVDNRLVIDVGHDSHSVTDHTQGNWNGIVGAIELHAKPPVWIEDVQVFPNVATKSVTVRGRIGSVGTAGRGTLEYSVRRVSSEASFPLTPALSPGEREKPSPRLDKAEALDLAQNRRTGLPLHEPELRTPKSEVTGGRARRSARAEAVPSASVPARRGEDTAPYQSAQVQGFKARNSIWEESLPEREGRGEGEGVVKTEVSWETNGGAFELKISFGEHAQLWDEFNPALYKLTATLNAGEVHCPKVHTTFGFREITTQGTQFLINGRRTFFRGTLECAIFPKTGHPPTDLDSWRKVIRAAKAHGLNMIRFHSWCPPEAAFVAADELGFYYQVEVSSWANASTTLGDGKPVDAWLYAEAARMLKFYGNHPSFVLMPYGNEPGGNNHVRWLSDWVAHWKKADSRRLYTSGSGWPQIPENEFHVTPDPRIQAWGGGLKSRINARPPETTTDYREYISRRTVPVISHEIGQWCVYPNFDEMKKYTGYLKPKNFEIFRDTLRRNHMGDQARDFLHASGKLQTLCYKEDIESALRTPGMGGFQLLDLHDFPGQGTALVGVLDPFWEEKGYVTAKEFSRFCNSTVPLARLAKRVFTTDEKLEAEIEVAHFGAEPLKHAETSWRLLDAKNRVVASGKFPAKDVAIDNGIALGRISVDLAKLAAPATYKLVVKVDRFENDWDVWIYPPRVFEAAPKDVTITRELDDAALAKLASGAKVLLLVPPSRVAPDPRLGKVALGFSSIFWNTAWTHRQAPHTLGILCDPKHPLFASFPTDSHSNWQWWYLISQAGAMILDDLPAAVRPQVQVIDDWVTNRRLGLFFEAKVNGGKLAVCSIDLESDLEANIVARQFRRSVFDYLASARFNPRTKVSAEQIRALFSAPSDMERLGARVLKASSEEAGFEAANAIDGNVNTMWHTAYQDSKPAYPHELQLQFDAPATVRGFKITPRQDHNRNGWIKDYAIYVSDDAVAWGEPVAKASFARDDRPKTITLGTAVRGRFIRFVALSGFDGQPYAAIAELAAIAER